MMVEIMLAAALVPQPVSMKTGTGSVPAKNAKVAHVSDASIPP